MMIETAYKHIAKTSTDTKLPVYLVGGAVRDQLLNKALKKDLDFVVEGSGIAFATAFATQFSEEQGRLITFDDFDTARYIFLNRDNDNEILLELEFAGARTEEYDPNSRKPKVTSTTIDEDLSRRDFTVNAMARRVFADGTLGDVIDPFEGIKDLEARLLRTPLDPTETFIDDPLRMLRAARFAAQLSFTIDPETLLAMQEQRQRLKIISMERVQEELMKLLATPKPSIGLFLLYQTKLLDQFLPEVVLLGGVEEVKGYKHKDNLSHTFAVVDNVAALSEKPLLRLAGLMHDIAKPQTKKLVQGRGWTFDMHEHLGKKMTRDIGKRLRMKKKDVEYVAKLVRWHLQPIALMDDGVTDTPVRRLIVNLEDDLSDLLLLCRADITTGNQHKKNRRLKNYDILEKRIDEVIEKDNLRAFQSPVRGEEIMQRCNLKPGPTTGKIKAEIERAILDGEIPNEYEPALSYFEQIKEQYLKTAVDWEKQT